MSATSNSDRVRCLVPFCRCTRKPNGYSEWLCHKHWALTPAVYRRVYYRLGRRYRKQFGLEPFWRFPAGSPKRLAAVRLDNRLERLWRLLKRIAIERAAGL